MPPLQDQLGRALFEAYNDHGIHPWKTYDGRTVPGWEGINDDVRSKWRAVAQMAALLLDPKLFEPDVKGTRDQASAEAPK